MDSIGIRNGGGENNAPPPLAGVESQFLQDLRRDLPKKLYRVGIATAATAVGGLVKQLVDVVVVAASARSRQAAEAAQPDDVPLSQLLLLVTLFGGMSTVYAGHRLEVEVEQAPTPTPRRWRKAGVAIYFFCFLLLVAAVSLVGTDYCELALNFIDVD